MRAIRAADRVDRGAQAIAFAAFLDGPTNLRGYTLLGRIAAAITRY